MKTDSLFVTRQYKGRFEMLKQSFWVLQASTAARGIAVGNATVADGRKPKRAITLHQLPIHTSGLGYTFLSEEDFASSQKLEGVQRDGGEKMGGMTALVAEPGEDAAV
ncbi:BQ5605_C001g00368 [Microbotryum silenes-dioicae]|uniref:BQ5605_C001g00368 protein n=1 Tax=Microbotryum silenes-dioicae TaxID=796604 RepID=A0A2X0M738_9BASI|nr:BQ5605_C001g00368 [Microbotryum silenes-dioicae]